MTSDQSKADSLIPFFSGDLQYILYSYSMRQLLGINVILIYYINIDFLLNTIIEVEK